jgi:hypothetical protein
VVANEAAVELLPVLRDLSPQTGVAGVLPGEVRALLEACLAGSYPEAPATVRLDGRTVRVHVVSVDDPDTAGGCVLILE